MKNPLLSVSLVILLCFAFGCQKQAREEVPAAITEDEAKIIAQKYIDSRNTVDLALLNEIYDPGVLVHESAPGGRRVSQY